MVCDNSHHTVHTHKVFHQYVSACVTLEVEEWWQCGCIGNIWNYAPQHFCEFQDGPSNYTSLRILCHSTDNWRASLWCGLVRVAGSGARLNQDFPCCFTWAGKRKVFEQNLQLNFFIIPVSAGSWQLAKCAVRLPTVLNLKNKTYVGKISQNFAP